MDRGGCLTGPCVHRQADRQDRLTPASTRRNRADGSGSDSARSDIVENVHPFFLFPWVERVELAYLVE